MDFGDDTTGNRQPSGGQSRWATAAPQGLSAASVNQGRPRIDSASSQPASSYSPRWQLSPGDRSMSPPPLPRRAAPETPTKESLGNAMPDSHHGAASVPVYYHASVATTPEGYKDLSKAIEKERARLGGWRVNVHFTVEGSFIDKETIIEAERLKADLRANPPATLPRALIKDALMAALVSFHPQNAYPYRSEAYIRAMLCRERAIREVDLEGLPGHYGHASSTIIYQFTQGPERCSTTGRQPVSGVKIQVVLIVWAPSAPALNGFCPSKAKGFGPSLCPTTMDNGNTPPVAPPNAAQASHLAPSTAAEFLAVTQSKDLRNHVGNIFPLDFLLQRQWPATISDAPGSLLSGLDSLIIVLRHILTHCDPSPEHRSALMNLDTSLNGVDREIFSCLWRDFGYPGITVYSVVERVFLLQKIKAEKATPNLNHSFKELMGYHLLEPLWAQDWLRLSPSYTPVQPPLQPHTGAAGEEQADLPPAPEPILKWDGTAELGDYVNSRVSPRTITRNGAQLFESYNLPTVIRVHYSPQGHVNEFTNGDVRSFKTKQHQIITNPEPRISEGSELVYRLIAAVKLRESAEQPDSVRLFSLDDGEAIKPTNSTVYYPAAWDTIPDGGSEFMLFYARGRDDIA
ncbi:hypothetical protein B0T19DRAFT_465287 [Cercophora scortea]|uniref:Uncharacterized protein n=1 Tax=Cercophora scortea TaxID=314031 RepID=A0AAE0I8I9_9PEZI|nr:hypothetical protein B0T19DRAFT_465287 [Cercophora scortea]